MSIDLVGPDGKEYALESDDPALLANAKAQGFRVASEIGVVDSAIDTAKAAALGAVQGVTGGLYGAGVGASQGDEETPESAKARWAQAGEVTRTAEEHPIAAGVGEFAGMVASPLNKAGELVRGGLGATSALGRIGANVAGGATVGALFGAGKTVSDAALGDVDLTAEKLLAGAGLGALLGGAGGGIGGAIEEGARVAMPGIRSLAKRAQSALDDVANDAAISSTRATQRQIANIGEDKLKAVAGALRDRGHLKMTPEAMGESLAKDRDGLGKLLGKFIDDADAAGGRPDHMRLLKRLDDFEASKNPLEREAIAGDLRAARKAVADLGANKDTFRALDNLKQTIQAKAKFSKGPVPLDDVTFGLKRQLAGVFRDELDQQLLPQLGADGAKAFTESKAIYGALKDAERLAAQGAMRNGGGFGLKDLAAAAIGSNIHPMGMAAALGSKLMREQGPAIVARLADRLAKEPALQSIAQSFAASLPATVPRMGQFGATLAQAAQVSPVHALATHMAYAQVDPEYAAHAQLAGLTPEAPDEHGAVMGRAQTLAEAQAAMRAQDDAVTKGIERVFRGEASPSGGRALKSQNFGAMRMRRGAGDAYDKRVAEVRELASNPEALIDRVAANMGPLGQTAPGVTAAMTNQAARAVAYLAQAAEVPPKAGPLSPEWDAPEADRFEFAQKLEVVQDPMSVLDSAAAGTLTDGQIEALRAVYPRLAQQMADAALERMTAAPASVPYRARLMLGMLSGVDPDGTMSADAIARNQAAIAAAGSKGREGAPGAPQANGEMSLADRTATPNQRREVRE